MASPPVFQLLTNCAACAAPLAHNAPRCVRCWTRYCDATCQHDHWRRGHKQICKKIHRGGNAEQYYADKKYKEAVAEAVEACAEDTKGQKCYICLEAVHPHTGEGLVRGCACGDRDGVSSPELGVAHVSCLSSAPARRRRRQGTWPRKSTRFIIVTNPYIVNAVWKRPAVFWA